MDEGWSSARQAFVQYEGGNVLDAAVLMMPLTKLMAPHDPVWLSTLDALGNELVSDSLDWHYDPKASPDGLEGDEGTFSICSFWYVEALTRPDAWTEPAWPSRRCSPTPTISACMVRKSATLESNWAIFPRPSRTSPSSAPLSTSTAPCADRRPPVAGVATASVLSAVAVRASEHAPCWKQGGETTEEGVRMRTVVDLRRCQVYAHRVFLAAGAPCPTRARHRAVRRRPGRRWAGDTLGASAASLSVNCRCTVRRCCRTARPRVSRSP